jgi:hypothetical protein
VIRSGPNGIVLQTRDGIEALGCTGLPETLVYDHVPEGLSDKPTLSIRASSPAPVHATVRLSYLATQFDWQANYVASLDPDGRTLGLFAWLTLANGNDSSFPSAQTQAVAGEPNREEDSNAGAAQTVSPEIRLQCWPEGKTSDGSPVPPPPPPPPSAALSERDEEDIVVTGTRAAKADLMAAAPAMVAQQEELGDLKLYRIPEAVTVAANAQKQVALMVKDRVPYERLYALTLDAAGSAESPQPLPIELRMKNLKARGLGLPLPNGTVAVFETVGERRMLAGEPRLGDTAVGEDVELVVGRSPDVTFTQVLVGSVKDRDGGARQGRYRVEVANARPDAAVAEIELQTDGDHRLINPSRKLGSKNGRGLWRVVIPANGRAALLYTVERIRARRR